MKQMGFGGGIATAGPCKSGAGGVFLSLWSIRSSARATFLPSTFTSKEKLTNSALPFVLLEATPPPAVPASSPVLVLKFESLTHSGLPSHLDLLGALGRVRGLGDVGVGDRDRAAGRRRLAHVGKGDGRAVAAGMHDAEVVCADGDGHRGLLVALGRALLRADRNHVVGQRLRPGGRGVVAHHVDRRDALQPFGDDMERRQSRISWRRSLSRITVSSLVSSHCSPAPRRRSQQRGGVSAGSCVRIGPVGSTPSATDRLTAAQVAGATSPAEAALKKRALEILGKSGLRWSAHAASYVPPKVRRG